MKRNPKTRIGQYTLAFQREPSPALDGRKKQELLDALTELLLEALGGETRDNQSEEEVGDESEDHA